MRRTIALLVICFAVFSAALAPVQAQSPAPSNPPSTCPYQQACEILQQAVALGAQYGLSPAQIDNLVPALVSQNPQTIGNILSGYGLDMQQQQALLTQAAPLLDAALSNDYLRQSIGQLIQDSMNNAGVNPASQVEVLGSLGDEDALSAALGEAGLADEAIDQFLVDAEFYGFSAADFDEFATALAFSEALSSAGVSDEAIDAYFEAAYAGEDVDALLSEAGVDLDAFYAEFDAAYVGVFEAAGFTEDDLIAFQEIAFLDYLSTAALDDEDLADLLAEYGFEEGDIDFYLENGIDDLLTDLGYDDELLAEYVFFWFELGFDADDFAEFGLEADDFADIDFGPMDDMDDMDAADDDMADSDDMDDMDDADDADDADDSDSDDSSSDDSSEGEEGEE